MIEIKNFFAYAILISLVSLVTACSDKKEKDEDLVEAFRIHQEAIKIRQSTQEQIEKLTTLTDSAFIATHGNSLDSISESLSQWDEQLVEVPGFEEEHHHHDHAGHDHDHDHSEGPDLTPQQHLEVQQYLLEDIKIIAEKVDQISI